MDGEGHGCAPPHQHRPVPAPHDEGGDHRLVRQLGHHDHQEGPEDDAELHGLRLETWPWPDGPPIGAAPVSLPASCPASRCPKATLTASRSRLWSTERPAPGNGCALTNAVTCSASSGVEHRPRMPSSMRGRMLAGNFSTSASHSSVVRRHATGPLTRLATNDSTSSGALWVRTSETARSKVRATRPGSVKEASA